MKIKPLTVDIEGLKNARWSNVTVINAKWHPNVTDNWLYSLGVDFYDEGKDSLYLYDYDNTGVFVNSYGTLKARINS